MQKTKKEITRFLVVGFSAVGTDSLAYWILLHFFTPSPSKAVSFLCGTLIAFVFNKYWTFEKQEKSYTEMLKFAGLYAATLTVNVAINKFCLSLLPTQILFAFLVATSASTVLNFIGQKWWVFKE